ncbi:MAG: hypothetical protein B6229_02565 [Spirochaetaceae bacterium 4572_7]|nr:MAG: hypothetical protein B6229_02565 [Spirochaetaceae bacterium 4572_7]
MKSREILIKIIYGLSIVFILIIFLVFVLFPFFKIDRVNLDSELVFSRNITEIAGLDSNSSFLFLNIDEVQSRLLREPLVRKVFIDKQFPNTLNITIFGREALVIGYANRDGLSIPLCFDENGVAFQIGERVEDVDLPVISGDIDFNKVTNGGGLPVVLVPLLKSLKEIRGIVPDIYSTISEIAIIKRGDMTYDLEMNFTFSKIRALLQGDICVEQLKNVVVVTSLLDRENVSVSFIDFRADQIVYKEEG